MPIPWLIGAAVIAVGAAVVKVVHDEIEEDERKERQLSEAKRQAEREKEEQRQKFEAAEQKRREQDRVASHKKKVGYQTSRLIEEHGLLNVDARQLAEEAISFPAAAKKTLYAAFDRSKPMQESVVQIRAAQQKLKQTEDLLIMLEEV